ncbi:MAG: hypothetical protein JNM18_02415 [Planctomycetaceae bacterium]|nr:hypothetical protein [Planctomycetaceae bacterium]
MVAVEMGGVFAEINMKREFANVEISCWETTDKKLSECSRSLHFWGRDAAKPILLHAIDEMIAEGVPSRRNLTLDPPDIWPRLCKRMRLLLVSEQIELKRMYLRRDGDIAILEFTIDAIREFRSAVTSWMNGAEDFRIAPANWKSKSFTPGKHDMASADLWFWTLYAGP